MASTAIAFIGLGQMGAPMAHNLLKAGFTVIGHDRVAAVADQFAGQPHFEWADSAAAAVTKVSIIVLMLPDSSIVDQLLWEGDEALSRVLKSGVLIIDMSSSDPMHTRQNAEKLSQLGIGFIDAPVSGGVKRAVTGALAIMIGGDAVNVERAGPVLKALGKTLTHVGESGAGHAVKALNNYVSAAGLLAVSESLAAAIKFGVDPHLVNNVFNASTGKNNTTENKVEVFMLSDAFNSGFSLSLMKKDLETAHRFIQQVDAQSGFVSDCLRVWQAADKSLGKGADHTEMYRFIKD